MYLRALFGALLCAALFAPRPAAASEAKARLIAEASLLGDRIRETRWTFDTRDEKKRLQRDLELLHTIITRVATFESFLDGCAPPIRAVPPGTQVHVHVRRTITELEVGIIERLVRLEDCLENDDWRWDNRDEKKALQQERDRLRSTLQGVALGLCGEDRVVTVIAP